MIIEHTGAFRRITTHTAVKFHPAYRRNIITVSREEQIIEQIFRSIFCRWLTRAHHTVDLYLCFQLGGGAVDRQRIGYEIILCYLQNSYEN